METSPVNRAKNTNLNWYAESFELVRVYYVTEGRNAWWSTWVEHYFAGSIHTTLVSAQSYCEARRVQGTVFYITELPAISIRGQDATVFVTQANSTDPLRRFSLSRLGDFFDLLPIKTMSLEQFVYVFNGMSKFWEEFMGELQPVLHTLTTVPEEIEPLIHPAALIARASRGEGVKYRLSWSERPFEAQYEHLTNLVTLLKRRIAEPMPHLFLG